MVVRNEGHLGIEGGFRYPSSQNERQKHRNVKIRNG